MARTTINVYEMEDTYVSTYANDESTNFGREGYFFVGYYKSDSNVSGIFRTLLRPKFTIPQNKKIVELSLMVNIIEAVPPASIAGQIPQFNLGVRKLLESWDEHVVTYNERPKALTVGSAFAAAPAYAIGWLEIPLNIVITNNLIDEMLETGIELVQGETIVDGRIQASSSEAVSPGESPYFKVTYADPPELPTQTYPINGEVVNNSGEGNIRFTWDYHSSPVSLYAQKSYKLQISQDALTWTDYEGTTANPYADIPATSVPSGYFYWRIQTTDTDDVPSDFSDTQLCYGGSAPTAPNITTSILDKAKPRLAWTASFTQAAYQVKVISGSDTIIDTAAATADQYFDFPVSVSSGSAYTVQVRAKNTDGIYSEWASASISASFSAPAKPTFVTVKKNNSVEITVTNTDAVTRNDVYRKDGIEWIRIGTTDEDGIYLDWSAPSGEITYKVVAVNDAAETESDEADFSFSLTCGVLTCVDIPTLEVPVQYNTSWSRGGEYGAELMQFAGRKKPVAEFDEHASRNISLDFETDDVDLFSSLEEAMEAKCTMLYRDSRIKLYGVCSNISCKNDESGLIFSLSCVLSEIEHDEAVSTE